MALFKCGFEGIVDLRYTALLFVLVVTCKTADGLVLAAAFLLFTVGMGGTVGAIEAVAQCCV